MATHHPMDRLHQHLDKAAEHAAQVHAAARNVLADSEAARTNYGADIVRETLTADGR